MAAEREMAPNRALTNVAFTQEFLDFFGSKRALQLSGFCVLYRWAGFPNARLITADDKRFFGLRKSSIYRAMKDLQRFRQHLLDQGYVRVGALDDASNTWELLIPLVGHAAEVEGTRQAVNAVVDSFHAVGSAHEVEPLQTAGHQPGIGAKVAPRPA